MNYDEYLDVGNPADEPEFECPECGKPMDKEDYCSKACWKASML